jgi:hypothetical protein
MKLVNFSYQEGYVFKFSFENGETTQTDLSDLLKPHIGTIQLDTARIDADWGCLEFNDGMIDREPKTLYRYAIKK